MLALLNTNVEKERKELLDRLPIYGVVSRHVGLKKGGMKQGQTIYKGCCPFHSEDTPSFYVYEHDNSFHCFGCQEHGDSITFIRKIENLPDGKVFERARELAGILPKQPQRELPAPPAKISKIADWHSQEWQAFAERELARCKQNMKDGSAPQLRFSRERGLNVETVKRFEIGWTGSTDVKTRVGGRFLLVRANSWVFPVRDLNGKIKMLKWRHTREADIKSWGKYGQLAGGEAAIFNHKRAAEYLTTTNRLVLAKGEFDLMLLWQIAGIDAACHTTGESSHVDITGSFQLKPDSEVFYIADRDTAGKRAAEAKQKLFPALRVAFPDQPYKDLGEQHLATTSGLNKVEIERILASSNQPQKLVGRRRSTQKVEAAELAKQEFNTATAVELTEARVQLAKEVRQIYAHPRLARTEVAMIKAEPGTGKGFAVNEEATRRAREKFGQTTGWFGGRLDMFSDQNRPADTWKLIEGRRPAITTDGEIVDFNALGAKDVEGNCSVEGSEYHTLMAEKGYERDSYKYCQVVCPLLDACKEKGYYALNAPDGRNAFMTFSHMFTSLGKKYRYLVADELSHAPFIDIVEIDGADVGNMRQFVANLAMKQLLSVIWDMLTDAKSLFSAEKSNEQVDEFLADFEIPKAGRLSGVEFYRKLDALCRDKYNGRGLVELIDQSLEINGTYEEYFHELLMERSPEAVRKLPKNFWHIRAAEPGAGGLFDIFKEEAKHALEGFGMPFVSRVELVREKAGDRAKILLHRRKYIPAELVAGKPFIVTDATGSASLLRELLSGFFNVQPMKELKKVNPIWRRFTPQIKVIAPRVEFPPNVEVIQDTRLNFSKTSLLQSLKKDPKTRYWDKYVQTIKSYLNTNERTLLVCAKAVKEHLRAALSDLKGYEQIAIEHYGNLRGSNAYKDWDCVIQAGMYMPNPEAIVRQARCIYGGDQKELDLSLSRVTRIHNHKDADGAAFADEVAAFADLRLQNLLETDREDEHVQVAHRIRPLEAGEPGVLAKKRIVLLFSTPLNSLPITKLITTDADAISYGAYAVTNKRSMEAIDKLVPVIASFWDKKTNDFCTPQMVWEALPEDKRGSLETIYKYWDEGVKRAGGVSFSVECIAPMPRGRGETRRTIQIAFKSGVTRKIINILIVFGVMPEILPKGWRLADCEETPQELPPELPAPPIETADEAPRDVQGQCAAYLDFLGKLGTAYSQAIADKGGMYSARAALLRERYFAVWDVIDKLATGKTKVRREVRVAS